ncbi:coiled-coil domain-containing protein 136-like [Thalassophryne amazonica]|uniref:coiled-coil domain-containing protein 136-like n=1 Tax=Thalassophryne amazonica TaxID=390379 RepID=UPI001470D6AD|nr:coiled-coil domain-containing protein 136-like [Thalassophryne amazonica]
MDGFHLPPVIEEVIDLPDEICELIVEKPIALGETLTAKERESMEENDKEEEAAGDGEKGQQEQGKEKETKEDRGGTRKEVDDLRAQIVQLLLDLEETRETSQRHVESFLELQGVLEEERLASAHQAESFTRQIQRLQAQLRSVQEEMDSMEEEKESELEEVQEELRSAQEDVLVMQQAAEEAAAERENDIASLQEELCRLRGELQRLHATMQEYELEVTTLRAEISMKGRSSDASLTPGDVIQLREEHSLLTVERQSLTKDKQELSDRLEALQRRAAACDHVYLALRSEQDAGHEDAVYISLPQSSGPPSVHSSDLMLLKLQLRQAEDTSQKVQEQCDGLKHELAELQQLYDGSQQERAALERELQRCKAELQKMIGTKSQQSTTEGCNLAVAVLAVAAIIVLVVPSLTRA